MYTHPTRTDSEERLPRLALDPDIGRGVGICEQSGNMQCLSLLARERPAVRYRHVERQAKFAKAPQSNMFRDPRHVQVAKDDSCEMAAVLGDCELGCAISNSRGRERS